MKNHSKASLYRGTKIALATMHGKERAVAPVFNYKLAAEIFVPQGLDTDALGTFTGEIARSGTMEEAALKKARLGMEATGCQFGLASEGSYGPHPYVPFIAAGIEHMVFIDDTRGIVVSESLLDETTNFAHMSAGGVGELESFLIQAKFPDHALVVGPHQPIDPRPQIYKGIRSHADLEVAVAACSVRSTDRKALIQTDMRAHENPTRMGVIARLAGRLAERIASPCPTCSSPGYGVVDVVYGLPCGQCGGPSTLVKSQVFGCRACELRQEVPRTDGQVVASPEWCLICNP